MTTVLFNFGHPFSDAAKAQLDELFPGLTIVSVPVQLDLGQSLPPQIHDIVDRAVQAAGLDADQIQTKPVLANLPGMSVAAALVLAELSGRTGYLPRVTQLVQKDGIFVIGDVVDLQVARNDARKSRQS